jgi:hypothetical protein
MKFYFSPKITAYWFCIKRFQFSCFDFCDYSSMSWNAGVQRISFLEQVKV